MKPKGYEPVTTLLLNEAVEENVDQVLVIGRSEKASLYFLSKGRVKKGISFEKDITRAFIEEFSRPEPPVLVSEQLGRRFSVDCKVTPNNIGDCFSFMIKEEKQG